MRFFVLAAVAVLTFVPDSEAGPLRRSRQSSYSKPTYSQPTYSQPTYSAQPTSQAVQSVQSVPASSGEAVGYYTESGEYVPYVAFATPAPAVTTAIPEATVYTPASVATTNWGAGDGLDEVNAKRAARGLRPFIRDDGLTQAAHAAAAHRAQYRMFGHTSSDFSFCRYGSSASSAGCAAYPASYGWMSCCTYDNYTYAGAAYVTGSDNRRYMHLFVR